MFSYIWRIWFVGQGISAALLSCLVKYLVKNCIFLQFGLFSLPYCHFNYISMIEQLWSLTTFVLISPVGVDTIHRLIDLNMDAQGDHQALLLSSSEDYEYMKQNLWQSDVSVLMEVCLFWKKSMSKHKHLSSP